MAAESLAPQEQPHKATLDRLVHAAAAARIVDALTQDLLLAPLEAGVIPLPHQLYTLSRAMSDDRIRYLLADEVGLGKTIEAGLVFRELKLRGLVERVLVVAPKGLGCKAPERIFNGAAAMKPWKTSFATNERRNKSGSTQLSFTACQTTEHWFSNRCAVGLIRCINARLKRRGHVSPGAIVPGLLLSVTKGSTVESMTTFDSTKESLIDLL